MKLVLNRSMDYFSLSKEVSKLFRKYLEEMGDKYFYFYRRKDDIRYRSHPALLRAIDEVGLEKSAGEGAKLEIFDLPQITDDTFMYFWIVGNDRPGHENGFEHIIDTRSFSGPGPIKAII